ncbi:class A beta-lactamase [Phenylobacterium deserti]|uniref:Beta-lactamase n=1 Tax=Phenylobacterium deserti TaxID=1914756 RepID=A0A328ASL9_9CAUL|nr:class A beta-lactamase [Phenylobacterium deserti]RAK56514.1 serine hydrolase [Phenylobacterium deserti]
MGRFGSRVGADASLPRRNLLIGGLALAAAACQNNAPLTASDSRPMKLDALEAEVGRIADRCRPGVLGVGLMNLENLETWLLNGERPFPMQSVAKLPLGAAVLAEMEAGHLRLDEVVQVQETDLSPPFSPVADAWPQRTQWTVRELLAEAVGQSDNTAADLLMRRVGGPGAITAWLVSERIEEVRLDRYARELQPQSVGLMPFRSAWRGEAAYLQAITAVPPAQQQAATARYMADPQDTATPRGMLNFLQKLDSGQLVSPASAQLLLTLLKQNTAGATRLRAGLPPNASLFHKSGTSRTIQGVNPATNDVGVFTLPNNRSYAIAVFLSGTSLDGVALDQIIAEIARAAVRAAG